MVERFRRYRPDKIEHTDRMTDGHMYGRTDRSTIFNQTWDGGVLSRGKLSGRKKLVHYRQCQGHIEDFACPFATKLGLVVQHYKPECSAEKVDYCVQGQGHSEDKKCQ